MLTKRMNAHGDQRGLTLIELIVVIAIITILFALGVVLSMEAFRGYTRRSERDTIVSVLQKARSRSMANVSQHSWGACFDGSNYDIFFTAYPSSPMDSVPANMGATLDISGAPKFSCSSGGIIFTQLSGTTSAATIGISQGTTVSTITINSEGRIDW